MALTFHGVEYTDHGRDQFEDRFTRRERHTLLKRLLNLEGTVYRDHSHDTAEYVLVTTLRHRSRPHPIRVAIPFALVDTDGGRRALLVSAYPVDEEARDFAGSGRYSEVADVFLEEQREKQLGDSMISANAYEQQYADLDPYND